MVGVLAVTVAAFLAMVVFWNTFAGRSPGRVGARVGMLLLVNALVLLTAGVRLNDQYLFFASWADLHGALTGTVTQTRLAKGVAPATAGRQVVRGQSAPVASHVRPLPRGAFDSTGFGSFTVHGRASGITSTVVVQLPPGYLARANAHRTYPVLEAFSGYPGAPDQWIRTMNLPGAVAQQVALGHMRSALIVEPQQWVPPGVDTECTNGSPGNPQAETWIAVDVPNWIAHHFRVNAARSSWAAIGLSAGGFCAAVAGMLHPAQFGGVINMGGYYRPELSPFYQPYPPHSPLAARYDLVALAKRPPALAIWMETSHTDVVSYHSSSAFLRDARPPLSIRAVVLRNAGHRISLWQALLPESLQWLGSALPGFR